ncbi:MAG: mechanosensitive ion channel family protein [Pyrinomonadaceae bacterium]|nr:mechanosensitive ion channel family protein [Pyrinomonadaceae bacterium]
MELYGIRLVGINAENGRKLLLTLAFIIIVLLARFALTGLSKLVLPGLHNERARFWIRQTISIIAALLGTVGVVSIWFDDPTRLTTAAGLVTAGLAFALQKVVTSIAGYIVILRSRVFTVGDRIAMSGVRGDVIALGFIQTTIMEMGQSPGEQADDPSIWVKSRQYTGRIVTVTNDKVFDAPVYNYSRDFPYLWDEMTIPITYRDDRRRAEEILLETARRHTVKISQMSSEALEKMHDRYYVRDVDFEPKVYWRITDNWLELTVRFIAEAGGVRSLKDAMSRDILAAFDEAGIGIASATFDIVGLPPLRIEERTQEAAQQ